MTAGGAGSGAQRGVRWHDGDTMLSFAVFAVVVFGMLAWRVADPAHWIVIAAPPVDALPDVECGHVGPCRQSCVSHTPAVEPRIR